MAIRRFGPPIDYSSMRFEAKHSFFKQVNSSNHNHLNLTKSLTDRHQKLQLFHLLSNAYLKKIEMGTQDKVSSILHDIIRTRLNSENLDFFKYISYYGVEYHIDDVINYGFLDDVPLFGKIKAIILNDKKISLYLDSFETLEFNNSINGYILQDSDDLSPIISLESIKNIFPLDLYNYEGNLSIIPKFPLK